MSAASIESPVPAGHRCLLPLLGLGALGMMLGWRWPVPVAGTLLAGFLVIDLGFLGANAVKVVSGGLLPLSIAPTLFVGLTTWRRGRQILVARLQAETFGMDEFLRTLQPEVTRVPGTAVFMTGNLAWVPSALLQNPVHNKVLHERVVLVHMRTADVPWVHAADADDPTRRNQAAALARHQENLDRPAHAAGGQAPPGPHRCPVRRALHCSRSHAPSLFDIQHNC